MKMAAASTKGRQKMRPHFFLRTVWHGRCCEHVLLPASSPAPLKVDSGHYEATTEDGSGAEQAAGKWELKP